MKFDTLQQHMELPDAVEFPKKFIITVNRRLSAYIIDRYDQIQAIQQKTSWTTLEALSINDWLKKLWHHQTYDSRCLLTPYQERILWIQAIAEHTKNPLFMQTDQMIDQLQQAWQFLNQWNVSISLPKSAPHHTLQHHPLNQPTFFKVSAPFQDLFESKTDEQNETVSYLLNEAHLFFLKIVETFEEICRQRQVISLTRVIPSLLELIKQHQQLSLFPDEMTLIGFEELYPQLHLFIHTIHTIRKTVFQKTPFFESPRSPIFLARTPFGKEILEIEYAAHWSYSILKSQPTAQIGCLFLNLSSIQEKVRSTFHQVFSTEKNAFNISLVKPLAEYSIIACAITSLTFFIEQTIELESLKAWLYSAFLLAAEKEMAPRLALSIRLSAQGASFIPWKILHQLLNQSNADTYAPQLANAVKQVGEAFEEKSDAQFPPAIWATWFEEQLQTLGWPGERSLNSEEYQLVTRFWKALEEFKQLNFYYEKLNLLQALDSFKQLLKITLFQPQTSPTCPIQVLGILEGTGILFDYLWVAGMNESAWPQATFYNPFIPIELQKTFKMPHACPKQEKHFSQEIINRLLKSADHVIFSYSRTITDQLESPSLLIKHIPIVYPQELSNHFPSLSSLSYSNSMYLSKENNRSLSKLTEVSECGKGSNKRKLQLEDFEYLSEPKGPCIQADETLRGGTSILKNQAACSFKAFAQGRLGVRSFPKKAWGIPARDKGNIIHKMLEIFWKSIKSHQQLLLLTENNLKIKIEEIATTVLASLLLERPWLSDSPLLEVEKNRIILLLSRWLNLEKQREPFDVIAVEQSQNIPLVVKTFQIRNAESQNSQEFPQADVNTQILTIKIDRIDQLKDGTYIFIDYKTGKISLQAWEGTRPEEPQLPFYWIMNHTNNPLTHIKAIAFAQIHAENSQFKGFSEISGILPKVEPHSKLSWNELRISLKEVLEQLLEDFYEGNATINPKKGSETCHFCGLQSLCRIPLSSETVCQRKTKSPDLQEVSS